MEIRSHHQVRRPLLKQPVSLNKDILRSRESSATDSYLARRMPLESGQQRTSTSQLSSLDCRAPKDKLHSFTCKFNRPSHSGVPQTNAGIFCAQATKNCFLLSGGTQDKLGANEESRGHDRATSPLIDSTIRKAATSG